MTNIDLSNLSALLGVISAGFWFYSAMSVSREKELKRRKNLAARKGVEFNLAGVEILDDKKRYDLVATLRHQAQWSKWGAAIAAMALVVQAVDKYI